MHVDDNFLSGCMLRCCHLTVVIELLMPIAAVRCQGCYWKVSLYEVHYHDFR